VAKRPLDNGRSDDGSGGDAGADEERPSRDPVRLRQGRHLSVDDFTGAKRVSLPSSSSAPVDRPDRTPQTAWGALGIMV
jgi:hypothetical protein